MNFTLPMSWAYFGKKLLQRIELARHAGNFTAQEASERHMRLAVGKEGRYVTLFWLVDETDGVIADAKFKVFGPAALIGAAEVACELLMRKTYDQAARITADLIDRQARDKADARAFPEEAAPCLAYVVKAIQRCAEQCAGIPCAQEFIPTPLDPHSNSAEAYPNFATLSKDQKIAVIEAVIASDIRPYIELDAGGIEVLDLEEDHRLIIAYQGACTSCYSATSTTLSAIQEIVRAKIDPHLTVIPDASFLKQ
jgi:NifU-like protein